MALSNAGQSHDKPNHANNIRQAPPGHGRPEHVQRKGVVQGRRQAGHLGLQSVLPVHRVAARQARERTENREEHDDACRDAAAQRRRVHALVRLAVGLPSPRREGRRVDAAADPKNVSVIPGGHVIVLRQLLDDVLAHVVRDTPDPTAHHQHLQLRLEPPRLHAVLVGRAGREARLSPAMRLLISLGSPGTYSTRART